MIKEVLYYFEGLDKSITQPNKYLINDHFEFREYTLDDFRKKFEDLIQIKETEDYDDTAIPPLEFSLSFAFALDDLKYFNQAQILKDNNVVFLRYAELEQDPITQIIEGQKLLKSGNFENEINNRVKKLIEKLKLFRSGHIKLLSSFEITNNLRCIPNSYSPLSKNKDYIKYSLTDTDTTELNFFRDQLEVPTYIELAFNSFMESYNIEDDKLKFVILMICLESIYNINGRKIKEKISRYAALTTIRDKQIFDDLAKRIKFLYELRSSIVHGDSENIDENEEYKKRLEDITQYNLELEEIVRNVLKQLILNDKYAEVKTKEDLLKLLNQSSC